MNIREIIQQTTVSFAESGHGTPRLDAEVLLSHCLSADRTGLYSNPAEQIGEERREEFLHLVARRRQGEPIAYIVGEKEFWSLSFAVDDRVLVPRPETEVLVEEVLAVCKAVKGKDLKILEIGAGSGVISVSLASELKEALFWATDISEGALAVAERNAARHGVAGRITFLRGDLFAPVSGSFHIIVSNPPYIPEDEFDGLPPDIRQFEPRVALVGGSDGIEVHRKLIRQAVSFLEEGGWIFLEIGAAQRKRIEQILKAVGSYDEIGFRKDYGGEERVVRARRKATGG